MYTGLEAFRCRHDLSYRSLSRALGGSSGVSKSSVERLCRGAANPGYVDKVKTFILDRLKVFLTEKGKSQAEIEAELNTLFPANELKELPALIHTVIVPAHATSAYVFKSPDGRTVGAFEFTDR